MNSSRWIRQRPNKLSPVKTNTAYIHEIMSICVLPAKKNYQHQRIKNFTNVNGAQVLIQMYFIAVVLEGLKYFTPMHVLCLVVEVIKSMAWWDAQFDSFCTSIYKLFNETMPEKQEPASNHWQFLLFIWLIAGIDFLEHVLIIGEGVCLVFLNFLIPGQWDSRAKISAIILSQEKTRTLLFSWPETMTCPWPAMK